MKEKYLTITLVRSPAGCLPCHKATVESLGLKRMRQTIQVKDNPEIRGMIKKVSYLLKVEDSAISAY